VKRSAASVLLVLLGLTLACKRSEPPPPKPAQPAAQQDDGNLLNMKGETDIDVDNLLNLAYGASVVARTGESNLELSALNAIDGLSNTFWSSPPGGGVQTLTFALAARSRIERLGVTSSKDTIPKEVRFEASADGKRWREVLVQKLEPSTDPVLADVKPFEARFLRITTTEPRAYFATLRSVHALGQELERPAARTFTGCWTINGLAAHFVQEGARLTGTIETTPPTYIDGGTDGRVARVVWLRSPNRGYATLSMDPTTRTLSGLTFYEELSSQYTAVAWFGKPCTDNGTSAIEAKEINELLERAGRWSIYGLAFDAREQLVEEESRSTLDMLTTVLRAQQNRRLRIVARELHLDAPDQRTAARVTALKGALQKRGIDVTKIEFVAAGSKWTTPPIIAAIQRLMASSVDLEIVKP
jgi:hypothetical protein